MKKLGIPGILLIVFIVLKLAKVIDWSWLWVLSPLWIGVALVLVFLILFGGAAVWLGNK